MGWTGLVSVAGLPMLAACVMFVVLHRLARSRTAAGVEAAMGMASAVGLVVGLLGGTRVLRWAPPQWQGGSSWLPWVAVLGTVCMAALASPAWPAAVLRGLPWIWSAVASAVVLIPAGESGVGRWAAVLAGTLISGGLWSRARKVSGEGWELWRGIGWVLVGCAVAGSLACWDLSSLAGLVLLGVAVFAGTLLGGERLGQVAATRGALPGFCLLVPPVLLTGALLQGRMSGLAATTVFLAALGLAGSPVRTQRATERGIGRCWMRLAEVVLLAAGGLTLAWWGQT
ncbi:MAG TPA: hypothetical protein DDY91_11235 [Planctomycetaceae bacterium]|nr:hypothetical protein [Planctomycetaceae bacterium]